MRAKIRCVCRLIDVIDQESGFADGDIAQGDTVGITRIARYRLSYSIVFVQIAFALSKKMSKRLGFQAGNFVVHHIPCGCHRYTVSHYVIEYPQASLAVFGQGNALV